METIKYFFDIHPSIFCKVILEYRYDKNFWEKHEKLLRFNVAKLQHPFGGIEIADLIDNNNGMFVGYNCLMCNYRDNWIDMIKNNVSHLIQINQLSAIDFNRYKIQFLNEPLIKYELWKY